MRRFLGNVMIDPESFDPFYYLVEKDESGKIIRKFKEVYTSRPKPKYTAEEQDQINRCNDVLIKNQLPVLTEEEEEFLIRPFVNVNNRLDALEKKAETTEGLQELAGFRVEKKIIPIT